MPYIADPDDTLIQQIGRALVAYALRRADVGDDETLRIPGLVQSRKSPAWPAGLRFGQAAVRASRTSVGW